MSELRLRNPHSVLAAIRSRPRDVLTISPGRGKPTPAWREVEAEAAAAGISIGTAVASPGNAPKKRGHGGGRRGGRPNTRGDNRQSRDGAEAVVRPKPPAELDDVLPAGEPAEPGLWLAIDCVQDPQNLGAILRSASFFGVRGVLLTKDKTAPLSATAYDIACGGVEDVAICPVTNLVRTFEVAKSRGLWVLGTSEHAELDLAEVDRDRSWLVVVGNEESGIRRLTADNCDQLCRVAPRGLVTSLNASVAAGVVLMGLTAGRG